MNKITAFGLFIKQCLLYPLESPFLPDESVVELGVSYAAGQKIGSYNPVSPALVWQDDQNQSMDFASAQIYAAYLDADGVNVDEIEQDIWRVPTEIELMNALCNSYIDGGSLLPGGFQANCGYWSSTPYAGYPGNAWYASHSNGDVHSSDGNMTGQVLVRCVH